MRSSEWAVGNPPFGGWFVGAVGRESQATAKWERSLPRIASKSDLSHTVLPLQRPPSDVSAMISSVQSLREAVEETALREAFAGVVRLDHAGETVFALAYGLADRAHEIPNTVETTFATASGTKGFTALTVMRLVERGILTLRTTARSLLGEDLPLIADDVTVEHLLAHRSGIGDYLDEDDLGDIADYVMPVPVHTLATTEQYLPVLAGHPAAFAAGDRFAYNNGGYVVLALMAERAAGRAFHELVRTEVCEPAGMVDTAFLRSDELPGRAALGYLHGDGLRTNVLHLPVRGSGDGGAYSTVADVHRLWDAVTAGRVVAPELVEEMARPRSTRGPGKHRYGLGIWLHPDDGHVLELEGYDTGVSFHSL